MATTTSQTFPAGTAFDAPEVLAAVGKMVRNMPRNMGYQWLVTVCEYGARTEVRRHAQVHHGFEAYQNAQDEPKWGGPTLLHWRLMAWSDLFSPDDVTTLKKLER
jgi:hypothetical protein